MGFVKAEKEDDRELSSMVAMGKIKELAGRIAKEFKPERIVLFGSYATGTPTVDSDVDLLVVMPFDGRSIDESVKIRLALRPAFPLDLLIRTSEMIQERIRQGDTFLSDIMENGKVLYAADHV